MTRARGSNATWTVRRIGVVRSPFVQKMDAPRQAVVAPDAQGWIELDAGAGLEDAVSDLAGWERIWVLFWFDRVDGWRPKVQPPRSAVKRGVLATRSPHRPNPIGLSCVALEAVEGLVLRVRGLDLLDGTPVLDVKPYVPYADAFPDARSGWLDDDEPFARSGRPPADAGARFDVAWSELAAAEVAWLRARNVDLARAVEEILATSPRPHAYRRIRREADGAFVLAFKDFRLRFRVDGRAVTVTGVATGYRARQLAEDPSLALHREFVAAFADGST